MTAEQLLNMPDDGRRYELIRGELIELSPAGYDHGVIAGNVYATLREFVKPRRLGTAVTDTAGIHHRV